MASSLRQILGDQFRDGTTAAGARIDRMLEIARQRFNALQPRDLQARWVESHYIGGHIPMNPNAGIQQPGPWLKLYNGTARTVGGVAPSDGYQNEWRIKGTRIQGLNSETGSGGYQYAWSPTFYFSRPVKISGLCYALFSNDGGFVNSFQYGGGAVPPGTTVGEALKDLVLAIDVDNRFLPETRAHTATVLLRRRFHLDGDRVTDPVGWPGVAPPGFAWGAEGSPGRAGNTVDGVVVHLDNLNLTIPGPSRVRLSIVIPDWDDALYVTGWASATRSAWTSGVHSWDLRVLEQLEA